MAFAFFKQVKSVSIRGLLICTGLVPMCLYADFLMWSFSNDKIHGMPQFFSWLGSFAVTFVSGMSFGILLPFQGVFISACTLPRNVGKAFGVFWSVAPLLYVYTYYLSTWVFDPLKYKIITDRDSGE